MPYLLQAPLPHAVNVNGKIMLTYARVKTLVGIFCTYYLTAMTPDEFTAARRSLGLSKTALATRLGVSRRTIWGWENGDVTIRPITELAMLQLISEGAALINRYKN
jgi:DNA-binding transcriptional regulator YiaG